MENISFLAFVLVIFAIIIGVAGIVLLIIGLIQNKKVLWISGAGGLILSVVIGIIGIMFIIKPIINNVGYGFKKLDFRYNHYNNIFSNISDFSDGPLDTLYDEPVSGFIEDDTNSPVYIRIFPEKSLLTQGIIIENVENGDKNNNVQKTISLSINFENVFIGRLMLIAYNYENEELSRSEVFIDKRPGKFNNINFHFPDETAFSEIKYCTLTLK